MTVIGFDMDEVLCDFCGTFIEVVNQTFGYALTIEDMKDYYVSHVLGSAEMQPVFDTIRQPERLLSLPAHLDGVSTLNIMKQRGHKIAIITSRDEDIREATEQWLAKYEVKYDKLFLVGGRGKVDSARSFKLDFFIEDNPEHANAVAELGARVFIPRYPWNRDKKHHSNATFIDNVSEIQDIIDA